MCVNRWFCCALIGGILITMSNASAEDKFRVGEGGFWSNGAMWSPPGVPAEGDDCFQDAASTGELQFMTFTGQGGKPRSLTVTPGGEPARAFRVLSGGEAFFTDIFTVSGAGVYTVTIENGATFFASPSPYTGPNPGVAGGNWVVGATGTFRPNYGLDLEDGYIELAAGARLLHFGTGTDIIGAFDSRISLLGTGAMIQSVGSVQVGDFDAAPGTNVNALGDFEVDSNGVVDGAGIYARRLYISSPFTTEGQGPSQFEVKNGAVINLTDDMVMSNISDLIYEGAGSLIVADNIGIPSYGVLRSASGNPTNELTIGFETDYIVGTQASRFSEWDARGVDLRCAGALSGADGSLELSYGDFGGILFVDCQCVSYADLIVGGLDVTLVLADATENAFRGNPAATSQDALYINGDVTIQPGSALDLNGYNVYYTGTLTADPDQIIGSGNIVRVPALNFGDFDGDCDVDLSDFSRFSLGFTGPEGLTADPLTDSDCDSDTDLGDFSLFSLNFTGAINEGCGGEAAAMSAGVGSSGGFDVQALREFCTNSLDTPSRERFVRRINTLLSSGYDGPEADALSQLATALR